MKNKKYIIIVSIIVGILALGGLLFVVFRNNNISNENINVDYNNGIASESNNKDILSFLTAFSGAKAEEIEIINTPVIGVKGKISVPTESITNGLSYFLEKTNNNKMHNIRIETTNENIDIYVNYQVTNKISTPIKVSINPVINENKDLVINISEVKILDLKLADFFVNLALKTFVKDWFNDTNIKVEYGDNSVLVYSENFKGISIESISLKNKGITLDAIIDMEKFIN